MSFLKAVTCTVIAGEPPQVDLVEQAKAAIFEEVKLRVPPLYRDQIVWEVTPLKHSIRVECHYRIPV